MNKEREHEICKRAINEYGVENQKVVAMEECSELIVALTNHMLYKPNNSEEEIADVEIMVKQLDIIYGFYDKFTSPKDGTEGSIIDLSNLIQAISKSIRDKNKNPKKEVAKVKSTLLVLKDTFDKDKINEFKKAKLERLERRLNAKQS